MTGANRIWNGRHALSEAPYGAAVIVCRRMRSGDDLYLLLRRDAAVDEPDGRWSPPPAVRRRGETVEACVHRELTTQTGLTGAALMRRPWLVDSDGPWQVWLVEAAPDAPIVLDDDYAGYRWVGLSEALTLCHPQWIADLLRIGAAGRAPYELVPGELSGFSALTYRFATVESFESPILVVGFGGEYRFGHRGNPDAVFMDGVVELGTALFNPFGVVLDLRGLDYRWGDQISKPIMSADTRWSDSVVVVSDLCREALTSLMRDIGVDPWARLCDDVDRAVYRVRNRIRAARRPDPAQ